MRMRYNFGGPVSVRIGLPGLSSSVYFSCSVEDGIMRRIFLGDANLIHNYLSSTAGPSNLLDWAIQRCGDRRHARRSRTQPPSRFPDRSSRLVLGRRHTRRSCTLIEKNDRRSCSQAVSRRARLGEAELQAHSERRPAVERTARGRVSAGEGRPAAGAPRDGEGEAAAARAKGRAGRRRRRRAMARASARAGSLASFGLAACGFG
jgi:hypothetical protein